MPVISSTRSTAGDASSTTIRPGPWASDRIVIRWLNHMRPELEAEGFARCVIEIEQVEGAVKLTVDHSIEVADSQLIQAVSGGWPKILSNLKSLLETGEVLLS